MFAKRSLGQNFLRDSSVIDRIVRELGPISDQTVLEIGPGRGALTEKLIDAAAKVIAVEFDRDMVSILKERFSKRSNLTVISADALAFDYSTLQVGEVPLKLAANLPYNISTPILQTLAAQRQFFSCFVLMFQREVVDRITAVPGRKDRGFLSVVVEDAFETEHLFDVPPAAFDPMPKVWSSVVKLTPKPISDVDPLLFRSVVSASFGQKRKTLLNNLKKFIAEADQILGWAGIDGRRRAETLTLDEWRTLTKMIEG